MSAQDVLVLAETRGEAVADISLEMLATARQLVGATGGRVIALLLSDDGARYAPALAAADRIVVVDDPLLAGYAPEPYLAVLEHEVASRSPRAVLIGSTSIGYDLAPLLAAKLGAPVVNGCRTVRAEGAVLKATASFYAGKLLADVEISASPAVLMILPGSCRPTDTRGEAVVEAKTSTVPLQAGAVTFQRLIVPEGGDVDITQQTVLVAVGRGMQQQDDMEVAEELATVLGGAVAASRPIIDQGWLPATRQVGKSGMTVKPKCFIALGISGAPEHVEGMKDAELIIAVNTDANAPIFDVADYGVVADLMEITPALTEALRNAETLRTG